LSADAPVVGCDEAGRGGFSRKTPGQVWIHRCLIAQGVSNHVVDSASREVNLRKRQTKTDRIDIGKLLTMLIRSGQGERKALSMKRHDSNFVYRYTLVNHQFQQPDVNQITAQDNLERLFHPGILARVTLS
jgi:hypothetical protein